MIRHITFASAEMSISGVKCCESALAMGAHKSTLYTPRDISAKFFVEHKEILMEPRGAGYWLWKPYFVDKALSEMAWDDYLIYTDAGVTVVEDVRLLIACMDSEVMVFGNQWRHGDWCRMDVLKGMGCVDWANREQLQASCLVIQKSAMSVEFIRDWLHFCTRERWITDDPSGLPNQETFKEHRHDQAILTNVALLYGLTWHWWPAQYSLRFKHQYPKDTYPQMFYHHRKRNNEW